MSHPQNPAGESGFPAEHGHAGGHGTTPQPGHAPQPGTAPPPGTAPQPGHGPQPGDAWGTPPPEPEKKRSWFARHKILTAVLAVVLVGAIGSALGGGGDDDATQAAPSPTAGAPTDAGSPVDSQDTGEPAPPAEGDGADDPAETDETEAPETAPEPEEPGIGEPVEVGDFTVTVNGLETGIPRVGSEMFGEEAQGQFVTVEVSVTNNGNSAEYFLDSGQNLLDEQGREHSSSSAVIYLEQDNMFAKQINPGNTATGVLLFDIPADAVPTAMKLSSGFFGRDVTVSLQ